MRAGFSTRFLTAFLLVVSMLVLNPRVTPVPASGAGRRDISTAVETPAGGGADIAAKVGPPAVVTAWGDPVKGLRVRLQLDTTQVSRLSFFPAQIQFEFLPQKAPKELTTLLHHPVAGEVTVYFKNRKTGRVYERSRTPPGFVENMGPEDYFDLRGILVPRDLSVRVLSPEGELIPGGDYEISAVYVNEKAMELNSHSQNYAGRLWLGTARTGSARFRIPDLKPQTVTFVAYDSLNAYQDLPVVSWHWIPTTRRRIAVEARPGFTVGHEEKAELIFPSSRREVRFDLGGAIDISPSAAANVTREPRGTRTKGATIGPPPIPFQPDSLVGIRIEETIFETSQPIVHDWKPETGDYKVLWSKVTTARLYPKPEAGK